MNSTSQIHTLFRLVEDVDFSAVFDQRGHHIVQLFRLLKIETCVEEGSSAVFQILRFEVSSIANEHFYASNQLGDRLCCIK